MDIKELESFKLSDAVKFHSKLNPALWTDKAELDPEVEDKLMEIAKDFMAELGLGSLKVSDITLSGSNTAFSYTPHSDLDLHILVDFSKLPDDEVYRELFNAKKMVYNDTHDLKVHGVPVELYVQDTNQPHASLGEYSLLHRKWLKFPIKRRANFDQNATRMKYEKLGELIQLALKQQDLGRVNKVLDIIKRYRQAGLDSAGEFGPENLAFKALRSQGYIQKLYDLKKKLHSKKLSLADDVDEDWHPNDVPPGPETKPTMPQGTVRVDVSDVYDWYKLGQNISNLDRVDKSKFGKGPPSTIMAFGNEPEEHKYIKALQNLGLTTTDIDPVDPHQPKGMPRQKVDPTYNVNENEKSTDLQNIIQTFVKSPIGQKYKDHDCKTVTRAFVHWADQNKIPTEVISLAPPSSKFLAKNPKFKGKSGEGNGHIMPIVNGNAVDFTVRQFGVGRPFEKPLVTPVNSLPSVYGKFGYFTDKPEWFLGGKSFWRGPLNSIPSEIFNQNFGDELLEQGVAEAKSSGYKEIEFVCVNPEFPDATDPVKQKKLYNELKKIEGVIPLLQDWSEYSEGQSSLTAIYKGIEAKKKILELVKKLDVKIDLVQPVSDSYVDRAIRGEHEGQQGVAESASGYIPSYAEKDDPRFKTALTVDIKPDTMKRNAKAFGFDIARSGIPPQLRASGKYKKIRTK